MSGLQRRALALAAVALTVIAATARAAAPLRQLKVPPGFHVSIFSDRVPNARAMALGAHDTVFVGSMRDGSLLVSDDDNGVIYRITYTGPAQ
jgi:hypothetical protein